MLSHALEYCLTPSNIVSLVIPTFACDSSSIAAFSVQLIRAPQIGSVAEFSAPRPPPMASPLPVSSASRAGGGHQPVPVPGHGPARDVTSRVMASRWPRRGDVTRGRNHRPLALPPGPLPNRCPLSGVCKCATTEVCQGLRALNQRPPRFTAMRVQTREAHWRRGLAQAPSIERAELVEELRARVLFQEEQRAPLLTNKHPK